MMPLYSPLNNSETKPGLSIRSKPLMIPRLWRPDQIQGRGPPGKKSPCRWAAGPSPSTNAPGVSAPWPVLRDAAGVQRQRSASLGSPRRGTVSKGVNPGRRDRGPTVTHVHAHAPSAHLAGALLPRAWGPRARTPRRLTGTALPAAPRVRSPSPGPLSYPPLGRPLHSPPRRRCPPPTPPCSCSERQGRGGGRGSESGARTHGRACTPQAGAAAGPGGGREAGSAEIAAARG